MLVGGVAMCYSNLRTTNVIQAFGQRGEAFGNAFRLTAANTVFFRGVLCQALDGALEA